MKVKLRDAADLLRLRELVNQTVNAKQQDRYRVVLIAAEGLGERLSRTDVI